MLDKLIEEHAVLLFFGTILIISVIVWIKMHFDEKKGENSQEKAMVKKILQTVIPEYAECTPVYAYWRLNTGRHVTKCWYYAIGLTMEKMYIIPLIFADKEMGYGQPMVLLKEQIGAVDCGKPGGTMHFLKFMDKNQNKIFEVIVEESNTKIDKTYPVNIRQIEETREFMKKIQQWSQNSK